MALAPVGHARSLAHLELDRPGTIVSVAGEDELLQRLSALGIGRGKTVRVLRRGWWSGPLHVRVGMTELMVRRRDARRILIESADQPEQATAGTGLDDPAEGGP